MIIKLGLLSQCSFSNCFSLWGVRNKVKTKQLRNDDQLQLIGEKIRKARLNKGFTQSELAYECGDKDWSQISRMERGLVNFSISYLLLVAEVLEIPPKELLP